MNLLNFIVKSSLNIILANPTSMDPVAFGSGCIVHYKDRIFLLSVAHVTDVEGMATFIETNLPTNGLNSTLYSVGGLNYFAQFHIPPDVSLQGIKGIEELFLEFDKTLDITFCEIKENISLLQPELIFGEFKIDAGAKIFLNFSEAGEPEEGEYFGFFGMTRHEFTGAAMKYEPKLELGLKYKGTYEKYHLFNTSCVIKDSKDYKGCSGAPILDSDGRLVGLVSDVIPETNSLFAFSIAECRKLLDVYIENELL